MFGDDFWKFVEKLFFLLVFFAVIGAGALVYFGYQVITA